MKDPEHLFAAGKSPDYFHTCTRTGRRIHFWGPFPSRLTPAQRGINGLNPSLTGDFLSWMIFDACSRHLVDGMIAQRNRESPADKLERLRRAKARARLAAEDTRAKGTRS